MYVVIAPNSLDIMMNPRKMPSGVVAWLSQKFIMEATGEFIPAGSVILHNLSSFVIRAGVKYCL